jgi:hypothetical protein
VSHDQAPDQHEKHLSDDLSFGGPAAASFNGFTRDTVQKLDGQVCPAQQPAYDAHRITRSLLDQVQLCSTLHSRIRKIADEAASLYYACLATVTALRAHEILIQ